MAKLVNRARMTTATTGTGTLTLGSAMDGYQSFAAAGVTNGDVVRYVIKDGNAWEIGSGTYTATGTTLSRSVLESSNSGNAISLSGNAEVFIGLAAEDIQQLDEATADEIRGFDDGITDYVSPDKLRDAAALTTPSGAVNWTPDWSSFVSAQWTVTADRTINNPTNVVPGTTRAVRIAGNSSTDRTISWGSYYIGNIPDGIVDNTTYWLVLLFAVSATEIFVSFIEEAP